MYLTTCVKFEKSNILLLRENITNLQQKQTKGFLFREAIAKQFILTKG